MKTIYSQPSGFNWPLVPSRSRNFIGVALQLNGYLRYEELSLQHVEEDNHDENEIV